MDSLYEPANNLRHDLRYQVHLMSPGPRLHKQLLSSVLHAFQRTWRRRRSVQQCRTQPLPSPDPLGITSSLCHVWERGKSDPCLCVLLLSFYKNQHEATVLMLPSGSCSPQLCTLHGIFHAGKRQWNDTGVKAHAQVAWLGANFFQSIEIIIPSTPQKVKSNETIKIFLVLLF